MAIRGAIDDRLVGRITGMPGAGFGGGRPAALRQVTRRERGARSRRLTWRNVAAAECAPVAADSKGSP